LEFAEMEQHSEQIACPNCGILLDVPAGSAGRAARCGKCKHRFEIPAFSENAVADLLSDLDDALSPPKDAVNIEEEMDAEPDADPSSMSTIAASVALAGGASMQILQIKARGVVVRFPAHFLTDALFRLSMPRICMCCGTRAHLVAHLVRFMPRSPDKLNLENRQVHSPLVLQDSTLESLHGEDLLNALPKVPETVAPADNALPYWVCDMCRDHGAVTGEHRINPDTQDGTCWMFIRNPHRAEQFIRAACGDDVPNLTKLIEMNTAGQENPWDLLPLTVRHRLEQWYIPKSGEHFLGYTPDRDHNRTEDGMAGVLVSNKRLIYHSHMQHKEIPVDETIDLMLAMSTDRGQLRIKSQTTTIKRVVIDREGVRGLRRALTLGKYKAHWK
jgi:transcription elongation factor Elf1